MTVYIDYYLQEDSDASEYFVQLKYLKSLYKKFDLKIAMTDQEMKDYRELSQNVKRITKSFEAG